MNFNHRLLCRPTSIAIPLSIAVLFVTLLAQQQDSLLSNELTSEEIFDEEVIIPTGKLPLSEISLAQGLPSIGKWMFREDFQKAHWLGVPWEGKNLVEPINLIFVDRFSKSAGEAIARLYENLKRAGYTDRKHHSSGYIGYINRAYYPQIPRRKQFAFSNEIAEVPNNHGRLFGPCFYNGAYFFTGAFSREGISLKSYVKHCYESFNRARDEASQSLDKSSDYKITRFVNLQNTFLKNPEHTTGDHDGIAVVLELAE
jgi:hypothetical protein